MAPDSDVRGVVLRSANRPPSALALILANWATLTTIHESGGTRWPSSISRPLAARSERRLGCSSLDACGGESLTAALLASGLRRWLRNTGLMSSRSTRRHCQTVECTAPLPATGLGPDHAAAERFRPALAASGAHLALGRASLKYLSRFFDKHRRRGPDPKLARQSERVRFVGTFELERRPLWSFEDVPFRNG